MYEQLIHTPFPSWAHVLNAKGYESFALHNYQRDFWRRDTVYPKLGFQDYFSMENLGPIDPRDWRPEDELLEPKIREVLNEDANRRPRFLFTVTMGMHGPYGHDPFRKDLIRPEAPWMKKPTELILTNYLTAQESTMQVLARLLDWAQRRKRPTLILAFGDHLPALQDAYVRSRMIRSSNESKWSREESVLMHRTPWFIYSNVRGRRTSPPSAMSPHCLGGFAIESAGHEPGDPFFRFLKNQCRKWPILSFSEEVRSDDPLLRSYELLVYDRTSGLHTSYLQHAGGVPLNSR